MIRLTLLILLTLYSGISEKRGVKCESVHFLSNDELSDEAFNNKNDTNNTTDKDDEKCALLINEINTDTPKKPEKYEFVELLSICNGKAAPISLRPYKLISITTGTENTDDITY